MSSLPKSNVTPNSHRHRGWRSPIPAAAVYVLVGLFSVGLCFSTFLLIAVHNAFFFVLLCCISSLIAAFLLWNSTNAAVSFFLHSFPECDLSSAAHGQLVKITGVASCGNVTLESSYERVSPCIYTSTVLYEYRDMCLKVRDIYSERHSTDFYVTDLKSGIRALVKAGPGSNVVPLILETRLIRTSKRCRVLSSDLKKWLAERKVSAGARSLCLHEGYIKEGSCVSVVGVLQKADDIVMIVEPHEMVSTGCLWPKLLLPVDVEGLVIGFPRAAVPGIPTACP